MKRKTITAFGIIVLFVLILSGCCSYFDTGNDVKKYVAHPTKINYTIVYGYDVSCTGTGEFNILYDCDVPEVLTGRVSITEMDQNYEDITLTNNDMKRWNISSRDTKNYNLGIQANVTAESFIVEDLSGSNALTIYEIKNQYYTLYNQYTKSQSNDTITFIDPDDVNIKSTAQNVLVETGNDNSFILAKNLFIWLKTETSYLKHAGMESAQPAAKTCNIKTGDCDDLSFLYISLCRAIGVPARFVRGFIVEKQDNTVSATPHAWAEVFVGGFVGNNGWIPVECACDSDDMETQINQNFGVESSGHLRLFVDDGSNESLKISLSDIKVKYDQNINVNITSKSNLLFYEIIENKELVVDNNNRKYT